MRHRSVDGYIGDLKSSKVEDRWYAAYQLGRFKDSKALNALGDALKDDRNEVRWHAALSLGLLGDSKAVPYLVPMLKDSNLGVRMCAARSLGVLQSQEAVQSLLELLKGERDESWITILWALGNIGDVSAVETLKLFLADGSEAVREETACALARLGHSDGESILKAMSQSQDSIRRDIASEALKLIQRR